MRDIISELDQLLLTKEAERESKPKTTWWPTEMFDCRRKLWFRLQGNGKSNPIDLTGLWKMGMGNELHSFVDRLLHEMELPDLETELHFEKEVKGLRMGVSGRMDNRFTDSDGAKAAFDLKTTFGEGIRKIRRDKEISRHYLGQMMVYLAFGDIDRMYLAFLGRDDSYRACFVLAFDSDGFLTIDGEATRLNYSLIVDHFASVEEATEMPARDYTLAIRAGEVVRQFQRNKVVYKSDWQCMYCPYRDACWAAELKQYAEGTNQGMFDE